MLGAYFDRYQSPCISRLLAWDVKRERDVIRSARNDVSWLRWKGGAPHMEAEMRSNGIMSRAIRDGRLETGGPETVTHML